MVAPFVKEQTRDMPTAALRQFCAAQADIYTSDVSMAIFKDLTLSVNGARSLSSCLSNLPCLETPDERLSFGWGPQNVVREPGVHGRGYDHISIIMALTSVFHEAYAAEVCHAFAVSVATDDDMLPHKQQWRALARLWCGALAASGFSRAVEDYIRLDPYNINSDSNLIARRCRVPPSSMVRGMKALSTVVSKKQEQVILVGGAVIGWFAAFAEYLYDLRVAILSKTGEKLHGDPSDPSIHVILVYHESPDLRVLDDHLSVITENADTDDPNWSRHTHILPFGGRVLWQSLLPQVFGHAFWALDHEGGNTLATLIGCAARALNYQHEPVAEGDKNPYSTAANESAQGMGLIQNITSWLPELRKGQGRMERQLRKDPQEAADMYEEMIKKLQKLCNCSVCSVTDSGSAKAPKEGYCLPVICETIVSLGIMVSRMTVASGIYPTRQGVQGLYASQAERRTQAKHLDITQEADRQRHYDLVYGNEWRAGVSRRMQNAVELFSGTRPQIDLPDSLVALAHEGICAYAMQLTRSDGSRPRPEEQGFIVISSGFINLRQKIFTRMSVEPVGDDDSLEELGWEEVQFKHISRPFYCK